MGMEMAQELRLAGWNPSQFQVTMAKPMWAENPGQYHGFGGMFTFADGHSEIHKWRDARTRALVKATSFLSLKDVEPDNADILWVQAHTSARK